MLTPINLTTKLLIDDCNGAFLKGRMQYAPTNYHMLTNWPTTVGA